jgi:hypothetical protein
VVTSTTISRPESHQPSADLPGIRATKVSNYATSMLSTVIFGSFLLVINKLRCSVLSLNVNPQADMP